MEDSKKVINLWIELAIEAEAAKSEMIPSCVVRDLPAPPGHLAQFCVKNMAFKYNLKEQKARGWIKNTVTGDVVYDTGLWRTEKAAHNGLKKALEELNELVAYREAMRGKNASVAVVEAVNEPSVESGELLF